MSVIAEAVKKATLEKEGQANAGIVLPKKPRVSFLAASAIFILVAAAAAIYFYEESKVSSLQNDLTQARLFIDQQKTESDALLHDNEQLQKQVAEALKANQQKIDELLGRAKVLGYEKETLEADNAQKEKKIAELEAQIEVQEQKEASLMTLIEEARKQLAAVPAAVVAAPVISVAPAVTASQAPAGVSNKA